LPQENWDVRYEPQVLGPSTTAGASLTLVTGRRARPVAPQPSAAPCSEVEENVVARSSTVVLSLNVGTSSLTAAVRDPELRMRVHVADVTGDRGRVLVSVPGEPDRRIVLRGGWPQALRHVAAAMDRQGLRPRVVAHQIAGSCNLLTEPRWADDGLLTQLRAHTHLGPLYLPRQLDVVAAARRLWPLADDALCPDGALHRTLPADNTAPRRPVEERTGAVEGFGRHRPAVRRVADRVSQRGASECSVAAVGRGRLRHTTSSLGAAVGILSASHTDVCALPTGDATATGLALTGFARWVSRTVTVLLRCDTPGLIESRGTDSVQVRGHLRTRLPPLRPGVPDLSARAAAQPVASEVCVPVEILDEEALIDASVRALPPEGTLARAVALAGEITELTSSAVGVQERR
jgi:acetate kinase